MNEIVNIADRRRIAELERRVANLEAQIKIWIGWWSKAENEAIAAELEIEKLRKR